MLPNNYTLITATENDMEQIQAVNSSLGLSANLEILSSFVKEQKILVAKSHERIVGYLVYSYLWDEGSALLQIIRVAKEHQKEGIGTELVKYLEEMLIQKGFNQLISSTEKTNIPSLNFHKRLGFTECGELDVNPDNVFEIFLKKKLI